MAKWAKCAQPSIWFGGRSCLGQNLRTGKVQRTQQLVDHLVVAKIGVEAKCALSRRTRWDIQKSVWAGGPAGPRAGTPRGGLGVPSG